MQRIVFCDFDRTITARETFVAMVERFAPEMAARVMPKIYQQQLTLRVGVRQILESMPSALYPSIIEFSKAQPIRPGLLGLLQDLRSQEVPFVVVSSGIQCMVETVLAPFMPYVHAIHAVELDASGDRLRAKSRYEGGTEIVAKAEIMATYGAAQSIAIGDSMTDWNMAMAASVVFARPPLTAYLNARGKAYVPWDTFDDVRDRLLELWP